MIRYTLEPSKEIWDYWKGDITIELIISSIADVISESYICYSATQLLHDLKLYDSDGKINKLGKDILGSQLHEKYHNGENGICIVNPYSK